MGCASSEWGMVNGMKGGWGGWKERWREKRNREGKRHNWKRRRRRGEEWWGKRMKILRPLVVSRKRKVALWRIDLRMGREYRQGRTRREPSINWIESGQWSHRKWSYVYSDHTIGLQLRYRQFRKSLAFSLTVKSYFSPLTAIPTIVHSCHTNRSIYHEISSDAMGRWMTHCCGLINAKHDQQWWLPSPL